MRRLTTQEIRARNAGLEEAKRRFRVLQTDYLLMKFSLDEVIRILDDLKIQEPTEVVFNVTRLDDGKREEGR